MQVKMSWLQKVDADVAVIKNTSVWTLLFEHFCLDAVVRQCIIRGVELHEATDF